MQKRPFSKLNACKKPPSLEECLEKLQTFAVECEGRRNLETAVKVCMITREALATYLQKRVSNPQPCKHHEEEELEKGFKTSLQTVRSLLKEGSVGGGLQRELVRRYAENIEFRLRLVKLLRGPGIEAVRKALDEARRELDRRQ